MKKSQLITITILFFSLLQIGRSIKPKQKGLVSGSAGNFKSEGLEQILAYSDFNRDGKIDILTKSATLSLNEQLINMYIWNHNLKEYQLWGSYPSDYVSLQSALVSSFKELDMFHLVLYYKGETNNTIKVIPYTCSNFVCQFNTPMNVPQLSIAIDPIDPSLLGIKGDIGLVFHANGTANILRFQMKELLTYNISPLKSYIQNGESIGTFKYSYNGDYDGDCLTDLILFKDNGANAALQFIRGNQKNEFKFIKEVAINEEVQHFTLQDINFDGKNDLILLLASSKLQIHYHRYGTDKLLCKGLDFIQLPYDFQISDTETRQIQRVEFSYPLYSNSLLLFGDFNNDGYEDLSLTFMKDTTSAFPQATLLQNVGCIAAACGYYNPYFIQQSLTLNLRTFTTKTISGMNRLTSKVSFVDIQEDGNLDFMFHAQVEMNGVKYMTIQPVYNNVDYDAFFVTITILTAKTTKEDLFENTEYIGGVASFFVTLLSGQLAPKTSNQLAQAGLTLQLPYIRQGLGRTNNYLEDLTITVPRNPYSQFKWSPIIPNSDILIVPPPLDSPNAEWTLNVLIEPTQKLGFVLLLVIVSLGVIGAVILNLSRKQKQQDKQTQQSFYTFLR